MSFMRESVVFFQTDYRLESERYLERGERILQPGTINVNITDAPGFTRAERKIYSLP